MVDGAERGSWCLDIHGKVLRLVIGGLPFSLAAHGVCDHWWWAMEVTSNKTAFGLRTATRS